MFTNDGNDVAGIRLPEVDALVATYTGWNLCVLPEESGEGCTISGKRSTQDQVFGIAGCKGTIPDTGHSQKGSNYVLIRRSPSDTELAPQRTIMGRRQCDEDDPLSWRY
jgi:hypothetical protein